MEYNENVTMNSKASIVFDNINKGISKATMKGYITGKEFNDIIGANLLSEEGVLYWPEADEDITFMKDHTSYLEEMVGVQKKIIKMKDKRIERLTRENERLNRRIKELES